MSTTASMKLWAKLINVLYCKASRTQDCVMQLYSTVTPLVKECVCGSTTGTDNFTARFKSHRLQSGKNEYIHCSFFSTAVCDSCKVEAISPIVQKSVRRVPYTIMQPLQNGLNQSCRVHCQSCKWKLHRFSPIFWRGWVVFTFFFCKCLVNLLN